MRWCGYVKQLEWGASFKGEKEGKGGGEGERGRKEKKDTTARGTEGEEEGAAKEKMRRN